VEPPAVRLIALAIRKATDHPVPEFVFLQAGYMQLVVNDVGRRAADTPFVGAHHRSADGWQQTIRETGAAEHGHGDAMRESEGETVERPEGPLPRDHALDPDEIGELALMPGHDDCRRPSGKATAALPRSTVMVRLPSSRPRREPTACGTEPAQLTPAALSFSR